MIKEALAEHAGAKKLIAQIKAMEPENADFNETVTKLFEEITQPVKEEEEEMFPKVRNSGVDLIALRDALAERKHQLSDEDL